MVLKFKDRTSPKNKIRIHVCGLTGHGKSTFANEYCKQAGLNPIVIDIDDTNYVTPANPDIDFIGNDRQIFTKISDLLDEIQKTDFDTIIYDGFDSSMEKITPKQKERNPFWHLNVRKQRCEVIMRKLLSSGKHLIFIGQLDSKIVDDPENRPSYPVKAMNNCVNVSYFCHVTKKGEFVYDIMKNRFGDLLTDLNVYDPIPYLVKQDGSGSNIPVSERDVPQEEFKTAAEVGEPIVEDNPIHNSCMQIKIMLENEGVEVTKRTMREKVIQLIDEEVLPAENREPLIKYIYKHCPEELD